MDYDVAVAGLGGMGSAILAHCASRGAAAIGVEQFNLSHGFGASSGRTRMIRKAYFEDPAYVPLAIRAYELWRELEHKADREILHMTGVLSVGEEDSNIIAGTRRAAEEHDLAIVTLSEAGLRKRFPMLKLQPAEVGLLEVEGGVLNPEVAIEAHLQQAEAEGAAFRMEQSAEGWLATPNSVQIVLSSGERIRSKKLILALGPWTQEAFREIGISLQIQRNVQAWFTSATPVYRAPEFPAFLLDRRGLPAPLYGFPDFGDGIKAAFHGFGDITTAHDVDREIDFNRDIKPIATELEAWMPGGANAFREAKVCMYALTPDRNFVVDYHPLHKNVILCGGFSGHGFKFAPVIGEIASSLALEGGSPHDIKFLSAARFSPNEG